MALKATVHKVELAVSDMDRGYYASHSLTLARHPSETSERMMVRLLAFAMYADEALVYGRGLSADDEPALWKKDLTGNIESWIDVGLPDERELRKACGRARRVVLLAYGGRGVGIWWNANQSALERLTNLDIIDLSSEATMATPAAVPAPATPPPASVAPAAAPAPAAGATPAATTATPASTPAAAPAAPAMSPAPVPATGAKP